MKSFYEFVRKLNRGDKNITKEELAAWHLDHDTKIDIAKQALLRGKPFSRAEIHAILYWKKTNLKDYESFLQEKGLVDAHIPTASADNDSVVDDGNDRRKSQLHVSTTIKNVLKGSLNNLPSREDIKQFVKDHKTPIVITSIMAAFLGITAVTSYGIKRMVDDVSKNSDAQELIKILLMSFPFAFLAPYFYPIHLPGTGTKRSSVSIIKGTNPEGVKTKVKWQTNQKLLGVKPRGTPEVNVFLSPLWKPPKDAKKIYADRRRVAVRTASLMFLAYIAPHISEIPNDDRYPIY